MPVTLDYVTNIISGAGVAGAFIIAIMLGQFITKKHHEEVVECKDTEMATQAETIKELRAALAASQQQGEAATEAARATNLILAGFSREIRR